MPKADPERPSPFPQPKRHVGEPIEYKMRSGGVLRFTWFGQEGIDVHPVVISPSTEISGKVNDSGILAPELATPLLPIGRQGVSSLVRMEAIS